MRCVSKLKVLEAVEKNVSSIIMESHRATPSMSADKKKVPCFSSRRTGQAVNVAKKPHPCFKCNLQTGESLTGNGLIQVQTLPKKATPYPQWRHALVCVIAHFRGFPP